MGLSFPTINGVGPNGSVIHYHPKPETNREITDKEIYLCDSGAQYL
jgi:Xaa-Pro aminopeptidase